jgi:hypothetical protein
MIEHTLDRLLVCHGQAKGICAKGQMYLHTVLPVLCSEMSIPKGAAPCQTESPRIARLFRTIFLFFDKMQVDQSVYTTAGKAAFCAVFLVFSCLNIISFISKKAIPPKLLQTKITARAVQRGR